MGDSVLRKTAGSPAVPTRTPAASRGNAVLGSAGSGRSGAGHAHAHAAGRPAATGSARGSHAVSAASGHAAHHGAFSNPVNGTRALVYVLIVDVALLAAILMWRVARRRIVPRFA